MGDTKMQPTCGKCGGVMTPADSWIHPELFLHDDCLPEELRPAPPGPDWRHRPPAPGLYIAREADVPFDPEGRHSMKMYVAEPMAAARLWPRVRWYGPIPPDSQ
jgi:hypothetical protein